MTTNRQKLSPVKRDLTKDQFLCRARKLGFEPAGFMGYFKLPAPFEHVSVCSLNGGDRRRDRLKYLQRALRVEVERAEKTKWQAAVSNLP